MERKELIYELKNEENELINTLEGLGFFSKKDEDGNIINNAMMGLINDRFNKGFYGFKTKCVREKLDMKEKVGLVHVLNEKHLEYRIKALRKINERLKDINSYYELDKKELIGDISFIVGEQSRLEFTKEYMVKPLTDLKRSNPVNDIKDIIIYDLDVLENISREELLNETLKISKKFQKVLPTIYDDVRAYGNAIGILTKATYGMTTGSIKESLRNKKINVNSNILYSMNKEHLMHRYISLSLILKYADMYSKKEYRMFLEKCNLIGVLSRKVFEEHNPGKNMYQDFVSCCKSEHNVKVSNNALKGNYSFKGNSDVVIGVDCEQMSMFDKPRVKMKEKYFSIY